MTSSKRVLSSAEVFYTVFQQGIQVYFFNMRKSRTKNHVKLFLEARVIAN